MIEMPDRELIYAIRGMRISKSKEKAIKNTIWMLKESGMIVSVDNNIHFTSKFILYMLYGVDEYFRELSKVITPQRMGKLYRIMLDEEERKEILINEGSKHIVKYLENIFNKHLSSFERSVIKAMIDVLIEKIKETDPKIYKSIDEYITSIAGGYLRKMKEELEKETS